jgi:hypothetical protein
MVHRRELDGLVLMFGVHGALWGNAMTWWDHDTGSIWSQPIGEAIAGPRKGATLELYPSTFTTWGAWSDAHPGTLALDVPAGNTGFDLDDLYLVVDFTSEAVAYPVGDLRSAGLANDVVAGLEIAIVLDPSDQQRWAVFSRRLDAQTLTLEIAGRELRDAETGTIWDPVRGIALDGPLQGEILDLLPGFTSFPGDYPTFWPDGRVWQP